MAVKTLTIQVTIDSRKAKQALDELERKAADFGGVVEQKATRSLQGMTRAIVAVGGALAAIKIGSTFVDAASESENLNIRLRVLLGSVEEGAALFDSMRQFASRVPFEFQAVMQSATRLAGVLRGGRTEIVTWMPLIGDLAAATGLGIEETTDQVARLLSAGSGAADRFRERGVLAMLGFRAGVAATAEQSREILIRAFEDPASKFRGATQELARSWTGLLSMMSDAWFNFRVTALQGGAFDSLKASLQELVAFAQSNTVRELARSFGDLLAGSIGLLIPLVKAAVPLMSALADNFDLIVIAAKALVLVKVATWLHAAASASSFAALATLDLGGALAATRAGYGRLVLLDVAGTLRGWALGFTGVATAVIGLLLLLNELIKKWGEAEAKAIAYEVAAAKSVGIATQIRGVRLAGTVLDPDTWDSATAEVNRLAEAIQKAEKELERLRKPVANDDFTGIAGMATGPDNRAIAQQEARIADLRRQLGLLQREMVALPPAARGVRTALEDMLQDLPDSAKQAVEKLRAQRDELLLLQQAARVGSRELRLYETALKAGLDPSKFLTGATRELVGEILRLQDAEASRQKALAEASRKREAVQALRDQRDELRALASAALLGQRQWDLLRTAIDAGISPAHGLTDEIRGLVEQIQELSRAARSPAEQLQDLVKGALARLDIGAELQRHADTIAGRIASELRPTIEAELERHPLKPIPVKVDLQLDEGGLTAFERAIRNAFGRAAAGLASLPALGVRAGGYQEIVDTASGFAGSLSNLTRAMTASDAEARELAKNGVTVASSFSEVASSAVGLLNALGALDAKQQKLASALGALGGIIGSAVGGPAGGQIGQGAGQFLGIILGALGDTKQSFAELFAAGGRLASAVLEGSGQLKSQTSKAVQAITEGVNSILRDLGASLDAASLGFQIRAATGDRFKVWVNGVRTIVDSLEEAINLAIVGAIRGGRVSGLSPEVQAAIQGFTGDTVAGLQEAIAFGLSVERLGLPEIQRQLAEQTDSFIRMFRRVVEEMEGIGAGNVLGANGLVGSLLAAKDAALGIQRSEEELTRQRIEAQRAQVAIVEAQLLAMRAEISARLAEVTAANASIEARNAEARASLAASGVLGKAADVSGRAMLGLADSVLAVAESTAAYDSALLAIQDALDALDQARISAEEAQKAIRDAQRRDRGEKTPAERLADAMSRALGPLEDARQGVEQLADDLVVLQRQLNRGRISAEQYAEAVAGLGDNLMTDALGLTEQINRSLGRTAEADQAAARAQDIRLRLQVAELAILEAQADAMGLLNDETRALIDGTIQAAKDAVAGMSDTLIEIIPRTLTEVRAQIQDLSQEAGSALARAYRFLGMGEEAQRQQFELERASLLISIEELKLKQQELGIAVLAVAEIAGLEQQIRDATFEATRNADNAGRSIARSFNSAASDANSIAERFRRAQETVADYLNRVLRGEFGGGSPAGNVLEARRQLDEVIRQARRGDIGAIESFDDAASALLRLATDAYATGPEFEAIRQYILSSGRDILALRGGRQGNVEFSERFYRTADDQLQQQTRAALTLGKVEVVLGQIREELRGKKILKGGVNK